MYVLGTVSNAHVVLQINVEVLLPESWVLVSIYFAQGVCCTKPVGPSCRPQETSVLSDPLDRAGGGTAARTAPARCQSWAWETRECPQPRKAVDTANSSSTKNRLRPSLVTITTCRHFFWAQRSSFGKRPCTIQLNKNKSRISNTYCNDNGKESTKDQAGHFWLLIVD